MRDPKADAEGIASFVQRDDRIYTPPVLECLCVLKAAPEVHREARRHVLRDGPAAAQSRWHIATGDPLTSPAFQVSVLLSKRLEEESERGKAFAVLPTRLEAPRWFNLKDVFTAFRDFEVPGVGVPEPEWLAQQGISDLPKAPLTALVAAKDLDVVDLTGLLGGSYDRVLWLDLGAGEGETTRLSWSLVQLGARRPYEVLAQDGVVLDVTDAPLVHDCALTPPATSRLWHQRLAWPAERAGTTIAGGVVAALFTGLALAEFQKFQEGAPGDPANARAQAANIAYGTVAIAGGATAALGLVIPGHVWRRQH